MGGRLRVWVKMGRCMRRILELPWQKLVTRERQRKREGEGL